MPHAVPGLLGFLKCALSETQWVSWIVIWQPMAPGHVCSDCRRDDVDGVDKVVRPQLSTRGIVVATGDQVALMSLATMARSTVRRRRCRGCHVRKKQCSNVEKNQFHDWGARND